MSTKRRDFIKKTIMSGTGLTLLSSFTPMNMMSSNLTKDRIGITLALSADGSCTRGWQRCVCRKAPC
jgi:hypothetical protein